MNYIIYDIHILYIMTVAAVSKSLKFHCVKCRKMV